MKSYRLSILRSTSLASQSTSSEEVMANWECNRLRGLWLGSNGAATVPQVLSRLSILESRHIRRSPSLPAGPRRRRGYRGNPRKVTSHASHASVRICTLASIDVTQPLFVVCHKLNAIITGIVSRCEMLDVYMYVWWVI